MISVEDQLAIQQLISRFAHYSDFGDWSGLETLFTPDAVTEMDGISVKYEGIAAQVEHAKVSDQQASGKNRHFYFNFTFDEVDGTTVVNYYLMNVNAGPSPMTAQMVVTGRHRDTVVKTPDGWKIARRQITFDQSFDLNF